MLAALAKHEAELQALAELYGSPAQMLGRVGLGDSRRTQILTTRQAEPGEAHALIETIDRRRA